MASRENQLQSQLLTKDADIEQLVLSKIQLGHDLLGRDAAIAELHSEVRTWRLRVDELMAELIGEQSTKAKLAAEYAAVFRPAARLDSWIGALLLVVGFVALVGLAYG